MKVWSDIFLYHIDMPFVNYLYASISISISVITGCYVQDRGFGK